ncbi:hypothetical protein ACIP2X_05135 [Streptomyces sp. NPDC089424]|uniref:hypothetical protein n=1 Tax=Streptomyces sp. NPDC089424 TaxID=3365917 RepID=UPI0038284A24
MNHRTHPDPDRDPARPESARLPEPLEPGTVTADTTALDLFRHIAAALGPDGTREATPPTASGERPQR